MLRTLSLAVSLLSLLVAACARSAETPSAGSGEAVRDHPLVVKALPGNYRDILEHADKFEIVTLACEGEELPQGVTSSAMVSRFRMVDRREVSDHALQKKLVTAFYKGVSGGTDNAGAGCFEPHHGIRATKDGETVTILVCFLCSNFYVLPEGVRNGILLDPEPVEVWRDVVKELGMAEVPLTRMGRRPP